MFKKQLPKEVVNRQKIERRIVSKIIDVALAKNYTISVDNGDDVPIQQSNNKSAILKAMFATDEERVIFYHNGKRAGVVYLVYGNSGWDVMHDHSLFLEEMLEPVYELSNKLSV